MNTINFNNTFLKSLVVTTVLFFFVVPAALVQAASWNLTASAHVVSPAYSPETQIDVELASDAAVSSAIVDIEIYDASGTLLHQEFFENQDWNSGETKSYVTLWTPPNVGPYFVKVGIFGAGWSSLLFWEDNAWVIARGGGVSVSPGETIEIWWPTDEARVSGIQPFKALVRNRAISTYEMYWRVDGGEPVSMYNSSTDFPHKEAIVDVSGWKWRGSGPYQVTIGARSNGGVFEAERTVDLYVE